MDEAEAVPGGGFPVALPHLADGSQGPLAVRPGLLVLTEPGVAVAEVVEDHRLPGVLPGRGEQVEGSPGVAQRVGEALLPLGQPGQAAEDSRLADLVTDLSEQREGVVETRVGVGEASGPGVPEGETVQRVRLPGHIVRPAGSLQPRALARSWSSQAPLRRKKVLSVHASCQAWVSKPAWPASRTAASSPACSALNQAAASSAVAGWLRDDRRAGAGSA